MTATSDQTPDTHAEAHRLIRLLGGPKSAAAALAMDPRNMQRIYSGARHASPTLLRRLAEAAEAADAR